MSINMFITGGRAGQVMYFVMLSGVILWGVYGYLIESKSVLIANIVAGLLQIVILILIFKNKNNKSTT